MVNGKIHSGAGSTLRNYLGYVNNRESALRDGSLEIQSPDNRLVPQGRSLWVFSEGKAHEHDYRPGRNGPRAEISRSGRHSWPWVPEATKAQQLSV